MQEIDSNFRFLESDLKDTQVYTQVDHIDFVVLATFSSFDNTRLVLHSIILMTLYPILHSFLLSKMQFHPTMHGMFVKLNHMLSA